MKTKTPKLNKKFVAGPEAHESLEGSIKRFLEKRPELKITYNEDTYNVQVADILRKIRKDAHLSQKELAKIIGSSQPLIARLEDPNAIKRASVHTIARVVQACGRDLVIGVV